MSWNSIIVPQQQEMLYCCGFYKVSFNTHLEEMPFISMQLIECSQEEYCSFVGWWIMPYSEYFSVGGKIELVFLPGKVKLAVWDHWKVLAGLCILFFKFTLPNWKCNKNFVTRFCSVVLPDKKLRQESKYNLILVGTSRN